MNRPPRVASRRTVLRVAAVSALAGCLSPSDGTDRCPDGADLSLVHAPPVHVSNEFSRSVSGLPYSTRTVVRDAIPSGEATSRGYYGPELHTDFVFTGEGSVYYRVVTDERDRRLTTGYVYTVEVDVEEPTADGGPPIEQFSSLPDHDREALRGAIGNTGLLRVKHGSSFSVVFAFERPEARASSAFVPNAGVRYLEWEDTVVRVTFDERRPVPIATATVSTARVASSPEAFTAYVGADRGVALDDLTDRHREIVERAIDDGHAECDPYSDPFDALFDGLTMTDGGVAPLVRYGEEWYFVHVTDPAG